MDPRDVRVHISPPVRGEDGYWVCRVVKGRGDPGVEVRGRDGLHALQQAVALLREKVAAEVEEGLLDEWPIWVGTWCRKAVETGMVGGWDFSFDVSAFDVPDFPDPGFWFSRSVSTTEVCAWAGCRRVRDAVCSIIFHNANIVTAEVWPRLAHCPRLAELSIGLCCNLTEPGISLLSRLEALDVARGAFSEDFSEVTTMSSLKTIFLQDLTVSDAALEGFGKMEALRSLDLFICKGYSDVGIERLARSNSLERIQVEATPATTERGLERLLDIASLRKLHASGFGSGVAARLQSLRPDVEMTEVP